MPEQETPEQGKQDQRVAELAAAKGRGFLGEMVNFLRHNKKWWLVPLLVTLGLVAVLATLGGTGVAPFIYTLF